MQSTSLTRLQESFPEEILGTHSRLGEDTATLKPEALARVARFLKEDPQLRFDFLMDLTAVDHWKRKPRFELVYHLYSRSEKRPAAVEGACGTARLRRPPR